jgi:hypothetical protein
MTEMSPSKRVQLVALCLIVVGLAVSTAAYALHARGTATLRAIGDETAAAGTASATFLGYRPGPWPGSSVRYGTWSLKCTGLTPGATYWESLGSDLYVAGPRGTLSLKGEWIVWDPQNVQVNRVEPGVYEYVLYGIFVWK